MCTSIHRLLLALFLLAPWTQAAAQQAPCVDQASMLNAFRLNHETRSLGLGEMYGAFFPEEAIDRGQPGDPKLQTFLVIRDGAGQERYRCPLYVGFRHSVWVTVRPGGTPVNFVFEEPGDYVYSIELDGTDVASVPFTMTMRDSGDPFNPVRMAFAAGPWSELAYFSLAQKSDPDQSPTFIYWDRGGEFSTGSKINIRVEFRNDGDTVFQSRPATVPSNKSATHWYEVRLAVCFPKADGGGNARLKDVVKKDGEYQAIIFRDEKPWKLFKFNIAGGRLVPHARQKLGYQPRFDLLLGRTPRAQESKAEDLIWMEAESPEAAQAAANATAVAVTAPSAGAREVWAAAPTAPAGRTAALKLTGIATRMDAGLAVGDDIIAFATGSIKGVSWMRVGEDVEHTLPGGQDFHSKHFFVCGKKIVMLRDAQVVVFDTETEQLHEVPLTEVSVAKSFLDNYKGNAIDADGYLVATLNDPKKVDDRVIPKIIDVSGPTPRVISLKNTEAPVRDIESITVDAATGKIVMGSYRNKCIWVADVAPRAPFEKLDLSSIDGYAREAAPMLSGGWLAYFDASGSKPKFRLIEVATKRTRTLPSLGKAYRCYDLVGDRIAFATTESHGSEYAIAIGTPAGEIKLPEGSGQSLADTAGTVGLGSSIAINGGLTFIAGQGKSGIGSGEYLQVSDGQTWRAILGPDGKLIPAVDVVSGGRVLAFKTGARNDTTVGYVALGANTKLAELPAK